jgi:hypothetical protein
MTDDGEDMTHQMHLERLTDAPPAVVFDAFTDPEITSRDAPSPMCPWAGLLLKDVVLLGAALYTAADDVEPAS